MWDVLDGGRKCLDVASEFWADVGRAEDIKRRCCSFFGERVLGCGEEEVELVWSGLHVCCRERDGTYVVILLLLEMEGI